MLEAERKFGTPTVWIGYLRWITKKAQWVTAGQAEVASGGNRPEPNIAVKRSKVDGSRKYILIDLWTLLRVIPSVPKRVVFDISKHLRATMSHRNWSAEIASRY